MEIITKGQLIVKMYSAVLTGLLVLSHSAGAVLMDQQWQDW